MTIRHRTADIDGVSIFYREAGQQLGLFCYCCMDYPARHISMLG